LIKTNDILNFKKEIEDFIASANLRVASNRFMDLNRELGSPSGEPILLAGRFSTIEREQINKTATKEEISVKTTVLSGDLRVSLRRFVDDNIQDFLKDDIEQCKKSINNNSEEGYEALLAIAKTFAKERVEQECIALKATSESAPLSKEQLNAYADLILKDYKLQDVERRFYQKQPKGEAELTPIPNDLVVIADDLLKSHSTNFTLEAKHLELRLGEITGLVGENATGKTTLLNILAGELAPQKGVVKYPLFDPNDRKDWTDLKMRIAYVSQELTPWEGSLLENLAFEAARHGIKGKENKDAVDYITKRLGLALHTNKTWQQLSGGYKLRFALAKALIWQPRLLILDEPLAYLDIRTQSIVLSDLREFSKSLINPLAILISSQHLHETESVADQMWFMRGGMLENLGSTANFNQKRDYHLFELSCNISFTVFNEAISTLEPLETWQNDAVYFIKGSLSINAEKLLNTLSEQHIQVTYFRDISQSVKIKFYDDTLI
jgi:ABC-2 type transport system ATP-binding protein